MLVRIAWVGNGIWTTLAAGNGLAGKLTDWKGHQDAGSLGISLISTSTCPPVQPALQMIVTCDDPA
jgi:hypothetical protein